MTQQEFDVAMTERAKMLAILGSILLGIGIIFLVFDIHYKVGSLLLVGAVSAWSYLLGIAHTMTKYYKEEGWRMH